MTRTLHYQIEEQHHGKSIGVFLKEKDYSRAVIIQLKKNKNRYYKKWALGRR